MAADRHVYPDARCYRLEPLLVGRAPGALAAGLIADTWSTVCFSGCVPAHRDAPARCLRYLVDRLRLAETVVSRRLPEKVLQALPTECDIDLSLPPRKASG